MGDNHLPVLDVDLLHIAHEEVDVPNHLADWIDDVGQVQIACGDFMEHRRKEKEIFSTDKRDIKPRIFALLKFQGRIKAAEAAAEDEDTCLVRHTDDLSWE